MKERFGLWGKGVGGLLFLGVLLLWGPQVLAGGGELVFGKGAIFISFDKGRSWRRLPLRPGYRFPEGVCLKVGLRSRAGLLLSDGSQIRLHGGTIFCLDRTGPEPPATTGKRGLYRLLRGKLWFRNKRQVPKPDFYTPSVVASIRGTEAYLEVGAREQIAVLDGVVEVKQRGGPERVRSVRGKVVIVEKGRLRVEKVVRPEFLAQWLILVPEIRGPADRKGFFPGVKRAQEAMEALFRWNLKEAERLSREALRLSPDRASVYVARAFVLQAQGRFEEALKMARRARQLDPLSIPAALREAELLLGEDRISEARKVLQEIKPSGPEESFWVATLKGYFSLIDRDLSTAEKAFRKALHHRPSSAYAWLGLGLAQWFLGAQDQALKDMEKASLCAPFWSWPHLYLGRALYERRERAEALAELRRATQLDPNDPSPYLVMAAIYRDLFRPARAIKALEKAWELNDRRLAFRSRFLLDQDRALRNVRLALSLEDLGLYTWAESWGDLAVWEAPGTAGAYYFRAIKAVEVSAADPNTLADLRKAHLLSPPNANTYTTYQDYTHFFTENYLRKGLNTRLRHNGDYHLGGYVYGGGNGWALNFEGDLWGSEGPVEGSERYLRQGLFRFKKGLSSRTEVLLEGVLNRLTRGDFLPWIYGSRKARRFHLARDFALLDGGFHHRFHAGSDVLTQVVFWREQIGEFENLDGLAEAVWSVRIGEHRLLFGGQHETRKEENRYFHTTRFEFWDRWHLCPPIWIFATGGYLYSDIPGTWRGREHLYAGVGLAWQEGRNTWRAAWFESAGVSTFSGTLLPTEMAGFYRFSEPDWSGGQRLWALGWDRLWSSKSFSRVEILREKRTFRNPGFTDGTDLWHIEERREVRGVWEKILGEHWGLGIRGGYLRFKAKGGLFLPGDERHREDWTLRLSLTYFSPSGWRIQGALAYFDREKRGSWLDSKGMHVLIPALSVLKYFSHRKGRFFLYLQAPQSNDFRFLPHSPFDLVNAPWPDFMAQTGLIWEW
ncbi:MAG: hypothetical protein DSZ24_02745 [Thermodesulfatator sp.]|nr:MAG: hypothetical protein DSZ24_02745 [Thermodesulfatator sp.]